MFFYYHTIDTIFTNNIYLINFATHFARQRLVLVSINKN